MPSGTGWGWMLVVILAGGLALSAHGARSAEPSVQVARWSGTLSRAPGGPPGIVLAQARGAPADICRVLAEELAALEKSLAYHRAETGTSATDALAAYIQAGADATQIQTAVLLLAEHKCPLPGRVPNGRPYALAAGECSVAMMRARVSAARGQRTDLPAECDMKRWMPQP